MTALHIDIVEEVSWLFIEAFKAGNPDIDITQDMARIMEATFRAGAMTAFEITRGLTPTFLRPGSSRNLVEKRGPPKVPSPG